MINHWHNLLTEKRDICVKTKKSNQTTVNSFSIIIKCKSTDCND